MKNVGLGVWEIVLAALRGGIEQAEAVVQDLKRQTENEAAQDVAPGDGTVEDGD